MCSPLLVACESTKAILRSMICHRDPMTTKKKDAPAPTPRKTGEKRPRLKPRPVSQEPDETPEAPATDRGVAPGITG